MQLLLLKYYVSYMLLFAFFEDMYKVMMMEAYSIKYKACFFLKYAMHVCIVATVVCYK
jgi:hypothetical protein